MKKVIAGLVLLFAFIGGPVFAQSQDDYVRKDVYETDQRWLEKKLDDIHDDVKELRGYMMTAAIGLGLTAIASLIAVLIAVFRGGNGGSGGGASMNGGHEGKERG